ncbi:hypothetical protein EV655_105160 [Rhodovulum euryhalinum]|uniref:Uncharacterized protein n=1 Tax=Rhodovulum euryhalinum TaxID=35805 RepID=A0A4R2KEU5_9RHOB|nr:hypothetical protein EV655_105160 [Rhodovulum euryhalinum]
MTPDLTAQPNPAPDLIRGLAPTHPKEVPGQARDATE